MFEISTVLDILARLSHLRALAEESFPNARAFVRPGFDETDTGESLSTPSPRGTGLE